MSQLIPMPHVYLKAKVSKRWIVIVPICVAAMGLAVIATTATVGVRWWTNDIAANGTERNIAAASTQDRDRTVTLLPVQLREGGFVPREIKGTPGNYELVITNISSEREGALRLEKETGEPVDTIVLRKGRNVRKLIRLTEGNYLLRVNRHRDWLTRIAITER